MALFKCRYSIQMGQFMPTTSPFELSIILRMSFSYLTADCAGEERDDNADWNAMQFWNAVTAAVKRL